MSIFGPCMVTQPSSTRDSASAVSRDYEAPFELTGATIEKVVFDVSGEHFVDHEAQVIGWFMKD